MDISRNFSVVQKISTGFGLLVLICLGIVMIALLAIDKQSQGLSEYQETVNNLDDIHQLEAQIAELQRQILAYRVSSSSVSVSELRATIKNIHANIKLIDGVWEFEEIDNSQIIEKIKGSVDVIEENVESLEAQRQAWNRLVHSQHSVFLDVSTKLDELKKVTNAQPVIQDLQAIHLYITKAQYSAVRYFTTKEYQTYEKATDYFNTSLLMLENVMENKSLSEANRIEISGLVSKVQNIKTIFFKSVQADRNFIFLVNVVIAGETSELGKLSEYVRAASSRYLATLREQSRKSVKDIRQVTYIGSAILMFIAVLSAVVITRDLVQPIKKITHVFNRLGNNESVDYIPETSRSDEVGQLARAANVFKNTSDQTKILLNQAESLTRDLTQREEELKKSNEELDRFAYVASHDLKSPLRAIHNLADWIEEDSYEQLSEPSRNHLNLLKSRIKRMENLLSDILRYSRADREQTSVETMSVNKVIDEALLLVDIPAHFTFHIPKNLPTLTIHVAPLIQVFQNLFSNAVKYNDKEQGVVSVTAADKSNEYIEFTVRDNGMGIPREFHQRIFLMFHTLHSRDEIESSGMGLAIIKKVIENQGGTISVESPLEDGGSCFIFTWPKQPINQPDQLVS